MLAEEMRGLIITEQEKFDTALFFFDKHCSMYNRGKIFNECHNLKDNLSLYDIENAIKTDIYFDCGVPCDSCMRMSKGFCTIIVNKGKICGRDNGYPFWIFPYRYWNKVMKHDNEIFG